MKIDPKIKEDLKKYLKDAVANKRKKITVISSYELNENDKIILSEAFPQFSDATVEFLIDNKILAGFIIKVGSKIFDLSLNGQLQKFKHIIYEIN